MNTHPDDGWSLVVPLKPLALAKSRLAAAAGSRLRPRLALAFAEDTVGAVLNCPRVRDVVVVTDDPAAGPALAPPRGRLVPRTPAGGGQPALGHP
ncbi:2-phospho-L-lactate guanylyltransferase, partial [Streptomyces sp. NPDC059556]